VGADNVTYNFSAKGAVTDLNQARPGIDLDGNIGLGSFKNGGTVNFKTDGAIPQTSKKTN